MKEHMTYWKRGLAIGLSIGIVVGNVSTPTIWAKEQSDQYADISSEEVQTVDEAVEETTEETLQEVDGENSEEVSQEAEEETNEGTSQEAEEEITEEEQTEEASQEAEEGLTEEVTEEALELLGQETALDTNDNLLTDGKFTKEQIDHFRDETKQWMQDTGRIVNQHVGVDYHVDVLEEELQFMEDADSFMTISDVPTTFDAREAGLVSEVKDQGLWGTCWAFSVVATAESAYKRLFHEEKNLSESHLVNFFYHDDIGALAGAEGDMSGDGIEALGENRVEVGGNNLFTMHGLARWTGVADEARDDSFIYPTDTYVVADTCIDDRFAFEDELHLQNTYMIAQKDQDNVKKAIMEFGAVSLGYFYDGFYDSDFQEYCEEDYVMPEEIDSQLSVYYNHEVEEINHLVTVVGWDDSFDRENFSSTLNYMYNEVLPEHDGAWLVKNSWGTDVGDEGYFWLSYEDLSIQEEVAYVFDFEPADNYDHNYQYDGSAGYEKQGGGEILTAAAVYTATGVQEIAAVGIGFADAQEYYTVQIYTNLEDVSDPESGDLELVQEGMTAFEGFYTIPLDEKVLVAQDATFSIVITVKKAGGAYLSVDTNCQNGNWIYFTAHADENQTFVKKNSQWKDAAKGSKSCTYRIKAYTNDRDIVMEEADQIITKDMIAAIMPQSFTGTEITPSPKVVFNGEMLTVGKDYQLSYQDHINVGNAKIIISGIGSYQGSVEVSFQIVPRSITKDMLQVSDCTYTGDVVEPVSVQYGEVMLMNQQDYTVSYQKTPIQPGNYTVVVNGIGNYTGKVQTKFAITKSELTEDMVNLSFSSATYTGNAIKPQVQVMLADRVLESKYYQVSYENNVNAGTGRVCIVGKSVLQGKIYKEFTILPKALPKEIIIADKYTYTGKAITPEVIVKDEKKKLKLNVDYVVSYQNNVHATMDEGRACAEVTGIGNYQGAEVIDFLIAPKDIKKIQVTLKKNSQDEFTYIVQDGESVLTQNQYFLKVLDAATRHEISMTEVENGEKYCVEVEGRGDYCGKIVRQDVVCHADIADTRVDWIEDSQNLIYQAKALKPKFKLYDGEECVSATNYKVVYEDNVNAGEALIRIIGKNEYTGEKKVQFTIYPKVLDNTLIIDDIKEQVYQGKEIMPKVKVRDGKRVLQEGLDYQVTYGQNVDVTYDENGTVTKGAYVDLDFSDNYQVLDEKYLQKSFAIMPASISRVIAQSAYYKGEGVACVPEIVVKAGKLTVPQEAFQISYADNALPTKKALVYVEAKKAGNYTGSKTARFAIVRENLTKAEIEGIQDVTYTGEKIAQSHIVLRNESGDVIPNSEYTISYRNQVKAGWATMIISAKKNGIYRGSIKKKFYINPAPIEEVTFHPNFPEKIYTGKAITFPASSIPYIFLNDELQYNKDYTVAYENNINAGEGTLFLIGKGNYKGVTSVKFTITPMQIDEVQVKYTKRVQDTGGMSYPVIESFLLGKTALKKNVDYTVTFIGAGKKGVAKAIFTGMGNYQGKKTIFYVIY